VRLDRKIGATDAGAVFIEPTKLVLYGQHLPPVINGMVVYRDSNHVTATYVRWLAPKLEEALKPILG